MAERTRRSSLATPYEIWVGLRYVLSGGRDGFVSFISFTSIFGIALGVALLIVVLSVMNGFERELRERILSVVSHASITGLDRPLADWRLVSDVALADGRVVAAAPFVEGQGLLVAGKTHSGVLVRGIDVASERRVADALEGMTGAGLEALQPGAYRIVLGAELAAALEVAAGDRVLLMVPEANVTPAGVVPRMRRFTVAGTFSLGMYEYDRSLAFMSLADTQALYRLGDAVSGVRLKLHDMFEAPRAVHDIAVELGGGFYISDWTRQHANFFRSIQLTKTVMFVILLLVVGVAAFNIVSTLVMVVKDKEPDIAILRTLGAAPGSVMRVFVVQGAIIGVAGTGLGLAGGALLATYLERLVQTLEGWLHTDLIASDVYYLSDLPARVQAGDLLQICGTALMLALLSTLYPSWRAARTQPADALRHE